MQSYNQWNAALAEFFFGHNQLGEPEFVYLSVDDEVLERVHSTLTGSSNNSKNPVESFVDAVKTRWTQDDRLELPQPKERDEMGNPLQIAFLGLLVLAASRMENEKIEEEEVTERAYYRRLNELLYGNLETSRPHGFDLRAHIRLWDDLQTWLIPRNIRLNLPSRREGPHYSVQFILSQALLNNADLYRLTYFYCNDGLLPGEVIEQDRLQLLIDKWLCHTKWPLSAHAKRVFYGSRRIYALQQISHHIKIWDGSYPYDPRSTQPNTDFTLSAFLNVNIANFGNALECEFFVRCHSERQHIIHDKLEHLGGDWYGPLPEGFPPESHTTDLPDSEIPIRLQPFFFLRNKLQVLILSKTQDLNLTGYFFYPSHGIGDKVLVMTCEQELERVRMVVEQLNGGVEVNSLMVWQGRPKGWQVFEPFVVKDRAKNCPADLTHLQPVSQARIWLEGGLLLARQEWLDGAGPSIRVHRDPQSNEVRINEQDVSLDSDRKLQNLEKIIAKPGYYCAQIGEKTQKKFSILSPNWPLSYEVESHEPIWQFRLANDGHTEPFEKESEEGAQNLRILGAVVQGELPELNIARVEHFCFQCIESEYNEDKLKNDQAWFSLATKAKSKSLNAGQTTDKGHYFDQEKQILGKAPIFYQTLLYKYQSEEQKTRLAFVLANKKPSFRNNDEGNKS